MEEKTKKCPYCGEEILAVAKKCKHCGEWLNNDEVSKEKKKIIPCPICGEMIEEDTMKCPHCNESLICEVNQETENEEKPIAADAVKTQGFFYYYFVEPFIKNYFKFNGRINRKHFWKSIMLWLGLSAILSMSLFIVNFNNPHGVLGKIIGVVIFIWVVCSIIPVWATILRRMKDGDSELGFIGWWFYILPIPYVVYIIVSHQPYWLCIIPFVILIWWLIKRSDNEMRDDGLEADPETKVEFRKSDKISLGIIIFVFLLTILPSSFGNRPVEKIGDIEEEKVENEIMTSEEIEIPYNILSVDEAISIYSFYSSGSGHKVLVEHGYQYELDDQNDYRIFAYWSKDCNLGRSPDGYLPNSITKGSSYVEINANNGINVYAFDKDVFKAWYKQLVVLGYVIEHNNGNRGQDWTAMKDGEPEIIIYDDYGDNYCLSIGNPYGN